MPLVGFESTIPVFERAKTIHVLDRATTMICYIYIYIYIYILVWIYLRGICDHELGTDMTDAYFLMTVHKIRYIYRL
jgi:uncharacterized membrane protein